MELIRGRLTDSKEVSLVFGKDVRCITNQGVIQSAIPCCRRNYRVDFVRVIPSFRVQSELASRIVLVPSQETLEPVPSLGTTVPVTRTGSGLSMDESQKTHHYCGGSASLY